MWVWAEPSRPSVGKTTGWPYSESTRAWPQDGCLRVRPLKAYGQQGRQHRVWMKTRLGNFLFLLDLLLPNQTWVYLPTRSKANLLTWGCGEGAAFIAGHQARSPGKLVLKRPWTPNGFQGKVFKDRVREGSCEVYDQLVDSLLTGWWWGNRESTSSVFWSQGSDVFVLVGLIQLTFFTWWGFQYLQNSSKYVAQNIIYSPRGGTKGPWLCLMVKLLLFSLAWLFSLLWLNLLFGTQESLRRLVFSTDKRQERACWRGVVSSRKAP